MPVSPPSKGHTPLAGCVKVSARHATFAHAFRPSSRRPTRIPADIYRHSISIRSPVPRPVHVPHDTHALLIVRRCIISYSFHPHPRLRSAPSACLGFVVYPPCYTVVGYISLIILDWGPPLARNDTHLWISSCPRIAHASAVSAARHVSPAYRQYPQHRLWPFVVHR